MQSRFLMVLSVMIVTAWMGMGSAFSEDAAPSGSAGTTQNARELWTVVLELKNQNQILQEIVKSLQEQLDGVNLQLKDQSQSLRDVKQKADTADYNATNATVAAGQAYSVRTGAEIQTPDD